MSVYPVNAIIDSNGTHNASVELSFLAQSVVVDNYSNQWVWLPAAARFVPPWQYGVQMPLTGATQTGQIQFALPPGQVASPTVAGQQCNAIFTDQATSLSLGQTVQPLAQQEIFLGTQAGGATTTYPLPNGTYALLVKTSASLSLGGKVTITGTQSSIGYWDSIGTTGPLGTSVSPVLKYFMVPIDTSQDTSVTVKSGSNLGTNVTVTALLYSSVIGIANNVNPIQVEGLDATGGGLPIPVINKAGSNFITTPNYEPTTSSIPGTLVNAAVANGGTVITAPGGGASTYITYINANAAAADIATLNATSILLNISYGARPAAFNQYFSPPICMGTSNITYNAVSVNQNCNFTILGYQA